MLKIRLSIQEIVQDYEQLTRKDERLNNLASYELLMSEDVDDFYQYTKKLCKKYIPNYKNLVPTTFNDNNTIDKSITLHDMLNKNFKEIIFQLI